MSSVFWLLLEPISQLYDVELFDGRETRMDLVTPLEISNSGTVVSELMPLTALYLSHCTQLAHCSIYVYLRGLNIVAPTFSDTQPDCGYFSHRKWITAYFKLRRTRESPAYMA